MAAAAGFGEIHEGTVGDSLSSARSTGRPVLVAGSLFLAGEVLALLRGLPKPVSSAQ
jgi:hypothetical protein